MLCLLLRSVSALPKAAFAIVLISVFNEHSQSEYSPASDLVSLQETQAPRRSSRTELHATNERASDVCSWHAASLTWRWTIFGLPISTAAERMLKLAQNDDWGIRQDKARPA